MPLILVIGLPSTGKTLIAETLSKILPEETVSLSTDIIRRKLFKFSEHRYSSFDTDIYTQENRFLVYNALCYFTDILLGKGHMIIIDGTFYSEATRQPFYEMCKRLNQKLIIIQTTCSDVTAKQRINKRKQHGKNVSDADFSIYKEFKERFEPVTVKHLIVDTDKDISQNIREVKNYLENYEII